MREQQRQRGLAAARRAPQDHRVHMAGLDRTAQRAAWCEQPLLAHHFIQRLRAHPLGERTHVVPIHGQQIGPIESRSVSGHVSIVSRQIAGGMPASGRHYTVIRR